MSTIGANNNVGRDDFSRLESDGFSRNVDRYNFGVRPVSGSSLVTELVEELSDLCELYQEEMSGDLRINGEMDTHPCE